MLASTLVTALGASALLLTGVSASVWTATLRPAEGSALHATARVESLGTDSLQISIDVRGAPPGATLPWYLYRGRCGSLTAVLGDGKAYPSLVLDLSGETWEVAAVAAPLAAGESYAVAIGERGRPAACGNLEVVVAGPPGP